MTPVRYTARDGVEIPAYLTLPKGVEGKNLPTILLPHGGPWARSSWGYSSLPQFLANRGYAVLQPNFRGSTGYGKKFLNDGNNTWGTGIMQHDLTDAVKYLVEEHGADVNIADFWGYTPVHYAAIRGDNELILYLVSKGADVTTKTRLGQTTADMARGGRGGYLQQGGVPGDPPPPGGFGAGVGWLRSPLGGEGRRARRGRGEDYCGSRPL